jgi:hypothetical protein
VEEKVVALLKDGTSLQADKQNPSSTFRPANRESFVRFEHLQQALELA